MMTHEQLQQIRTIIYDAYCEGDTEAEWMLVVIDAELAKPEQEPVGCKHSRYDVYEQTGNCLDCGAEGRMRFVVDDTAPPTHYDQTALELCEVCGWKTLIPGDGCLNCERGKVEQEPVPAPQREWVELEDDEVTEIADRCIDVFGLADLISEALRTKNEEKNT